MYISSSNPMSTHAIPNFYLFTHNRQIAWIIWCYFHILYCSVCSTAVILDMFIHLYIVYYPLPLYTWTWYIIGYIVFYGCWFVHRSHGFLLSLWLSPGQCQCSHTETNLICLCLQWRLSSANHSQSDMQTSTMYLTLWLWSQLWLLCCLH